MMEEKFVSSTNLHYLNRSSPQKYLNEKKGKRWISI